MRYSKGVMWLDDCRIPFVDDDIPSGGYGKATIGYGNEYEYKGGAGKTDQQGRFTPNLLCMDDVLNDGNVVQYNKTRVDNGSYLGGHREEFVGTDNNPIVNKIKGQFFSDKGTNSRYYDLDLWFDKMLERL
jgi:hypothetical protein